MKEMSACIYKYISDNSSIGVIILEENFVQIGLIIAEIILCVKRYLDLHFQGRLM